MRLKLKYLQPKPNFAFVFIFLGCTLYSVHVKLRSECELTSICLGKNMELSDFLSY